MPLCFQLIRQLPRVLGIQKRCGVPRVSINVTVMPAMSETATTCGSVRHFLPGIDVSQVTGLAPPGLTLQWFDRLRGLVRGKLLIKGIVTGEDAQAAIAHGADGVIVSNHGGRNEETLRASIDCVAEVVAAAEGRVPVLMDGGARRGTDVFKALALGASGVGIGRPQGWGLAAFGQEGAEAVLDIYAPRT